MNDKARVRIAKSFGFVRNLRDRNKIEGKVLSVMLRKKANQCSRISDLLDMSFRFRFLDPYGFLKYNIKPVQWKCEIEWFLHIVADKKPETLVEVGVGGGGTFFLLTKLLSRNGIAISVDLWNHSWKTWLYRTFGTPSQRIVMVCGNSHEATTLKQVENALDSKAVDVLFIDGDHTYEGVKKDFEMYGRLVREGGIIGFHDIDSPRDGVKQFWNEAQQEYLWEQMIINEPWGGIGVLHV